MPIRGILSRVPPVPVALGAVLLLLLAAGTLLIVNAQAGNRRALHQSFEDRATGVAEFMSAYVVDLAARERRLAEQRLSRTGLTDADVADALGGSAFSYGAVVLDRDGRVIAAWPPREGLPAGTDLAAQYDHLQRGVAGEVAASGVVPSAGLAEPVVAVAVPFESPEGRRVFSGGFATGATPVRQYLQTLAAPNRTMALILDGAGGLVASGGEEVVGEDIEAIVAVLTSRDNRRIFAPLRGEAHLIVARPVLRTPWQVVLAAPVAEIEQPVRGAGTWLPWIVLAAFAVAGAAGVALIIRLQSREVALQDSEQRFALAAQATQDAIYDWDVSTGTLRWHANVENTFGYTLEEMGTTISSWTDKIHPEDAPAVDQQMGAGVADGSTFLQAYRLRRRNGTYAHVLDRRLLVRDAEGRLHRMVGALTDFSQQTMIQQELERSNAELERFAYVASHDLQEPLRAVTSYAELLSKLYRDKPLDTEAYEFLDEIVAGGARMRQLINDLLAYSRVTTQGQPPQPTSARMALESALANLSVAVEETGALVTYGLLPVVRADSIQLVHLFQNLVGNALKYRRPGDSPRVEIEAEPADDGWWRFTVRDNGIGIEPRYAERVFILFQRLHTRDEYPGTGIGLAICRKIVERHGGRLWVESAGSGLGATFSFTLPAARTELIDERPPLADAKPLEMAATTSMAL